DTRQLQKTQPLPALLKSMPSDIQARALRYRLERDAYNLVAGRILLQKGLKELGLDTDISKIRYLPSGKPILESVHFSISHSEHLVLCALYTEGAIGLDVEVRQNPDLKNFKDFFTKVEWQDIMDANDSIGRFYFYWTRKEAVIKALGVNLDWLHRIGLDTHADIFTIENKEWFFKTLNLGVNVYGALCVSKSTS
ncbi:MAG TPA: 4'-phosphopantetheinyl transferase superfamily protein, partial [Phaeodactylibacter sp.]|nr:4'-phosphopantetheinyl transferase superfamily protein [Phaeodactylibacter sp.]